ncbi:MAG: ABC transporter substrate-binding protein [Candidatus Lokiarchaeota archaeon]|nr:ABC transporter substrate-binding protein [Candidatus Lokiarchaeota archaeon]
MLLIRKNKLRIGHLSTAYHANFVLMGNKDLNHEFNKDIRWKMFGTGPSMVKAFQDNKLDIGYMGLPPAIIGIDNEVPIKCVAGGHVEGTILVANKAYKSMAQLNNNLSDVLSQFKGCAIGVPSKGSIHEVILNFYLKKYSLVEDIEVKHYKQAEFIATDMQKEILGGGVGTPALAVFSSTIFDSHLIIPPEFLWKDNPSYGIFFHESMIENEPETVLKFLHHNKEASLILRETPSKAANIISKTFEILTERYVSEVLKISPKYCIALSERYIKSTMEFVRTLKELGYIKKELRNDDIFDLMFVQEVHPEPEHYSK